MNTDSKGETPLLLQLTLGHFSVIEFPLRESAVLICVHLCSSVFICGASLNNVAITASQTRGGGSGGGFANLDTGIAVLNNVVVTGNQADGNAGGIYNDNGASLILTNSSVTANQTIHRGYGGGIGNSGTMSVQNSLVGNNQTDGGEGGGIANFQGVLTLLNSSVINNSTPGDGGGLYNTATLNAYFVTIAGNLADSYATGAGGGGGISNAFGTVSLRTTLVGQNYAGRALNDISGPIFSQDYNFIQTTAGGTISGATTHNITGLDPLLESPQDNGGPTRTRALLQGSAAIDAVPLAQCTDQFGAPLRIDQRGFPRPNGSAGDIGACEGVRSLFVYNRNLIRNGDADGAAGSPASVMVGVPYWQLTAGEFTAVPYNATGGFPNLATDAVPTEHGYNFLAGGPGGLSSHATQPIDVSAIQADIDTGKITYTLSGDLGGYAGQGDAAQLVASFDLASGGLLSSATIGPVSAVDRGGATGFRHRSSTGSVPVGTRQVRIDLSMQLANGPYNDGYADNLSLVLLPPLRITSVSRPSNGHFLIDGISLPNVTVSVLAAPDLATPFTAIGSATAGANGGFHYDDASAVSPVQMRFYRVSYP